MDRQCCDLGASAATGGLSVVAQPTPYRYPRRRHKGMAQRRLKGRALSSIDAIEGIGAKDATRLRKAGVRTTEALLKKAGARKGRRALSRSSSLTEKQLLVWVNRADLMRVKGIGSEYSDLLEAVGVDTIKELRNRNAGSLTRKITEVNNAGKLVRRLPTEGMVGKWIRDAKKLSPAVSH